MVVKRRRAPYSEPTPAEPDVELMEQLVKKSLDVNPELRGGKSTHEVLAALREEAIARSKSGGTSQPEQPTTSLADRRRGTIAFFLEQKVKEFGESEADISAREKVLRAERAELQARVVDDIEVFLALLSDGNESPEVRMVLTQFKHFLQQLGTSETQLLAAARRRT